MNSNVFKHTKESFHIFSSYMYLRVHAVQCINVNIYNKYEHFNISKWVWCNYMEWNLMFINTLECT
jgi:arginyl-tRNA--protein-N-Asp/Glu arginylyltransferase